MPLVAGEKIDWREKIEISNKDFLIPMSSCMFHSFYSSVHSFHLKGK